MGDYPVAYRRGNFRDVGSGLQGSANQKWVYPPPPEGYYEGTQYIGPVLKDSSTSKWVYPPTYTEELIGSGYYGRTLPDPRYDGYHQEKWVTPPMPTMEPLYGYEYLGNAALAIAARPGAYTAGPEFPWFAAAVLLGTEAVAETLQYLYDRAAEDAPRYYVPVEKKKAERGADDLVDPGESGSDVIGGSGEPIVVPAYTGWTMTTAPLSCNVYSLYTTFIGRVYYNVGNCGPCAACTGYTGPLVSTQTADVAAGFVDVWQWPAHNYKLRICGIRKPGTIGAENSCPIIVGYSSKAWPTSKADEEDVATTVRIPLFMTPWALPIKRPGEVRLPVVGWPFAVPGVRPVPQEIAKPDEAVAVIPGSRVITKFDELASILALSAAFPTVPKKGADELKVKTLAAMKTFKKAYGFVTEMKDFARALWKGLPPCMRRKYGRGGPTVQQMGADVANAWSQLNSDDIKAMLKGVIENEITDRTYGQMGKFNKYVSGVAMRRTGNPFGFGVGNYGQGFSRTTGKKGSPRFDMTAINDAVDHAVDNIWGPSNVMGKVQKVVRDKAHPGKTKFVDVRCGKNFRTLP